MKTMKDLAGWLALNGGLAAAVWFGYMEGVEGARNVALFLIWFVTVPASLMVLSNKTLERLAKEKDVPTPIRRLVGRAISLGVLGVLVWSGSAWTAAAFGAALLLQAAGRRAVRRLREVGASSHPTSSTRSANSL